jgi:hypothetical protein
MVMLERKSALAKTAAKLMAGGRTVRPPAKLVRCVETLKKARKGC